MKRPNQTRTRRDSARPPTPAGRNALRRSACLCIALAVLAGCSGPKRGVNVYRAFAMAGTPLFKEGNNSFEAPTDWDTATLDAPNKELYDKIQKYKAARDSGLVTQATRLRDDIVFTILTMIHHYHQGTTDDLYGFGAGAETGFDLLGLTLNGLSAVTGGLADKAIYGAVAGASLGFRNSLSEHYLAEQTQFALMNQMQTEWFKAETRVRTNLRDLNDSKYSLAMAVNELYTYYSAGSIKGAVEQLVKSTSEKKDDAAKPLDSARQPAANRKVSEPL